jgi:hypothetical protein
VCEDASYSYSVTNVSGHTYSWSTPDGTIIGSTTSNSVSIEWASPGTGDLSVTETITSTGCSKTVSISPTVTAAPVTTPIQH